MNLRPEKLDDIIGQSDIVERLNIVVESSERRNEAMPHMLFDGPPGLGKTTLAIAVANSRDVDIEIANAGNLKSTKQLMPYLFRLSESSVLFIDEIHRLPIHIEEFLYPVMEDFRMDVGNAQSELSMDLPLFTMMGATTEAGKLSRPFYDRFIYKFQLKLYDTNTLADIVISSAKKFDVEIEPTAALNIAKRSRGTPRVANNLMKWLRDYHQASDNRTTISNGVVDKAMSMCGVDHKGITERDRMYLSALKKVGKPIGLRTMVDLINVDADTIQNVIEPFLLRLGYINRTPKGRVLA